MKLHHQNLHNDNTLVISRILTLISWILATLLGLIIGSSLIGGTLAIPAIPETLAILAGWFIVVLTILGAALALVEAHD